MSGFQQGDVPLDVRMRNLILQNAANAQTQAHTAPSHAPPPVAITNHITQPALAPNSRQKRPNQAQRRQMLAQTTVPIDSRSAQPHNRTGPPFRQHQPYGAQASQARGFQTTARAPHARVNHLNFAPPPPDAMPASGHSWRQPNGMQNGMQGNQTGARPSYGGRNSNHQGRSLYNPQGGPPPRQDDNMDAQVALLERLGLGLLASAEIDHAQIEEMEQFRLLIEDACRTAIDRHEREVNGRSDFPAMSVQLRYFGSIASGFATKTSDMDLGLLSPFSQPQPDAPESMIPRILEKVLLDMGLGTRLLTKTRVPIIKVCSKPPPKLLADLLDARAKWEKGEVDQDPEQDVEQDLDEDEAGSVHSGSPGEEKLLASDSFPLNCDGQAKDPYQTSLDELKQGSKTLNNYYWGSATKLLRRLGIKDISSSTASTRTPEEYRKLNDVCGAFIRGLADDALRERLQRYGSLVPNSNSTPDTIPEGPFLVPMRRSLLGVFTQIEGTKIIMAYESRSLMEHIALSETQLQQRVAHWITLQDNKANMDPFSFIRALQLSIDAIKKFPSVAVMNLEQYSHELASSYHARAIKLLIDLGGFDSPQSDILPVVLENFVRGIHDFSIQHQVSDFVQSLPGPSLRAAARRHKSLQLAKEFEKALEKDLYPAENVDDIRQYIDFLRGPLEVIAGDGVHFDTAFPTTLESSDLVARIRTLEDPARMSPNQPKDRYNDKLNFPKSDIGVQCDINFSAHLGLQNSYLLRCYAHTDPRVRPLVLFVKHWAKVRGINTPFRGTLSSYGYVLMVLHYLINVCRPFVCPNLQRMAPPVPEGLTPEQIEATVLCKGRDVRFWRDEEQIKIAAQRGELNQNADSLGFLLRGFFEYYAHNGVMSTYSRVRCFDWSRDVISFRSPSGLLTKNEKGWVGAKTVLEVQGSNKDTATEPSLQQANPTINEPASIPSQPQMPTEIAKNAKSTTGAAKPEVKEVRHRFLLAIEDPFELDHNVARTVVHSGIVAIRDEFRRAWRIIKLAGRDVPAEDLLQDAATEKKASSNKSFLDLLDAIHGRASA